MAQKIVDISKYISADAPQMVMFGKTYTIKNDKKTILEMSNIQDEAAAKGVDVDAKIIELLVGEEGGKEIYKFISESPNYTENSKAILFNIMALATGQTYEEVEDRFQKQKRNA